ncbi:MAG: flagellar basal body-associated protein FliL [Herminiimonas sp.]|nr:flagellar basal body-associated protein FliL [Herminiimonas sp.]
MATAPKSVPKIVPTPEAAAAPVKSKKKLFLIIGILLLVLGGGGGAAWYFLGHSAAPAAHAPAKPQPGKPPVFMVLDAFTVNLQPETGEQFLQIAFTLQVADQAQVDLLKLYMPQVRSRLLLLLSSKKPSEISTVDGKKILATDIIAALKQPFSAGGVPQSVSDVFFTSFVIQ